MPGYLDPESDNDFPTHRGRCKVSPFGGLADPLTNKIERGLRGKRHLREEGNGKDETAPYPRR